ncbi:AAA family ATPase [Marisediminicola sp. LYQ134]|uniref:AAA family ATPase n=1 Tax=Marisediminicola sp. LYQ134 TaxID=3391061 RepID=UPI0039833416
MPTDEENDRQLVRSFKRFLDRAVASVDAGETSTRTPLGDRISHHLGVDAETVPVVSETIADHRLVDVDLALDAMSDDGAGELVGVGGGQQKFHTPLPELVSSPHVSFGLGPVDYVSRATGPSTTRQVVAFGLRLFAFEGAPVAIVQRSANPQFGREAATLEVMGASPEATQRVLGEVKRRMIALSVLRGQVLSFEPSTFGGSAGVTFLPRPEVPADAIILPEGVLATVVDHVVGIGEHRDVLLRSGQHLKRGVLLFGPPGTGKTLTVRHLLGLTPGVTAVLLTGSSIAHIGAAAEIARTFEPSIVVLEDIDLVAMQRHSSPQPLLFEVLDALDGLDGDADVPSS